MNNRVNLDDLVGVPYVENGRDKNGFDCYGYAIEVCRRFGKELPDLEEARKENRDFMACLKKGLELAKLKESDHPENPADLVFFNNTDGVMNHIGVYLGDGLVTHCNAWGVHTERLKRKEHFIGRCYIWL